MFTLRDQQSGDLFDPWEYLGPQRRRLLEQSWAGVFRDYLLQHLPVKGLAAGFRGDFGRPSKDLSVAIGALILQQLHDLTDQRARAKLSSRLALGRNETTDCKTAPRRAGGISRTRLASRDDWLAGLGG